MKKIFVILLLSSVSFATYTYTITEYQMLPDLFETQSMLITGQGGGGGFFANDYSSVTVESTSSPLEDGVGGVWEVHLSSNSSFSMSGGQVGTIVFNNNATAILSGGLIQQIWSQQIAWKSLGGEPPQIIPNPHITIVYSGTLPTLQTIYGLPHLVGTWGDGDPFSIYLSDVPASSYGYSPAIDNIRFELIPEPTTMLLLGLGGLLIRRKK